MAKIFEFKGKKGQKEEDEVFEDDYLDSDTDSDIDDSPSEDKAVPETGDYKKKIARHRRVILYKVLIAVVLCTAIGAGMYINYERTIYTGYNVLDTIKYAEVATANYREFNNNILRYSTDGASAFNMQDEMLWNQTYEMQSPMVDICNDYVGIGDYKGTKIYLLNSKGLQGEIDTTLPIQNFKVSGNGVVAVVLEEKEVTWVRIFNREGNVIASDRTTMAKSGYPVNIALSDNGILLAVSYLKIETNDMVSSVAFYNFGNVGQNEIDNLVSGYNYENTVVSYVEFMNDRSAFAVGDNKFTIFRGGQKPESVFEIDIDDEIKSVFHNEDYIGLVFVEGTSEAAYRLDVYDTSGELVLSKPFDLEYTDIIFHGGRIVIYNSNNCLICNMDGMEKYDGAFQSSVIELVPTSSNLRYLLVSGNKTEKIQLK
ncbi:MAG: DUF5711 family protein [Lachnospiraceae bacterium]|nr:DUF5711 family protein [Lachnospiraceae bacterium]